MSITIQTPSGPLETTLRDLVLAISAESTCSAEADAVLMNMIEEGRVVVRGLRFRQVGHTSPAIGA